MSSSKVREFQYLKQMHEQMGKRLEKLGEEIQAAALMTPQRRAALIELAQTKAKIAMAIAINAGGDGQHATGTWVLGQSSVMPAIKQEYPGLVYYPTEDAAWGAYRRFDKLGWIKKD